MLLPRFRDVNQINLNNSLQESLNGNRCTTEASTQSWGDWQNVQVSMHILLQLYKYTSFLLYGAALSSDE